jgi:hypothetical protein
MYAQPETDSPSPSLQVFVGSTISQSNELLRDDRSVLETSTAGQREQNRNIYYVLGRKVN